MDDEDMDDGYMDDEDMDDGDIDMDDDGGGIYISGFISHGVIDRFIVGNHGEVLNEKRLENLKKMLRQFLFNEQDGQVTQYYESLRRGHFNDSLNGQGKTLLNEMFDNLFHEQFNPFLNKILFIPRLTNADDLRDSAHDLRGSAFTVSDAMIGLCKDLVNYEKNNKNVSKPGFINYIKNEEGTEKELFEEGRQLHFYVKPHKTVGGRRPQKSKSRKRRQSSKKKQKQTKKKRVRKRRTNKSKRKQTTKK